MRDGLAGLTLRGRAFLAAGTTAIVCAVLLGQTSLTRIGVLVVVLPLVAAFVIGRRRYALTAVRSVHPRLVAAGQPARIDLLLSNEGRSTAGAILVEDQVPYALGTRPRFVLQGIARKWQRRVSYQVRSDVRGRFDIGPLTIRIADPFGLIELRRLVPGTAPLVVTPRTVALPPIPVMGGWTGSGEYRPQAFAAGSAEDVSVREYRRGDELRRVHWRSSARMGDLMVRREEQPWEARATVLLDNRLRSHRGQGLGSSFEFAVVAAASLVLHLDQHGYAVRLVLADGTGADETSTAVLERLALVTTVQRPTLDLGWSGDQTRGGLVVAVLGGLEQTDSLALRQLRHDAGTALALVLDVDQWGGRSTASASELPAESVAGLGWRAVTLGPRDRIDSAWRDLGRASGRTAAAAGLAGGRTDR
ncbi:DUF58 domain-containing protein [Nocardioides silvaticus]|uniref:DUF58 domain-containing protein n=1 Tax=Nocardioides silvaticus TaxID=2201891 RepID=A0A316TMT5_9ACTN|nr:DUF58 domain-containing protein [Nocardioides silvaticus]PWN03572.1 DUF58 domain-containing protein [Nocardioides silvaticus]